MNRHNDGRRALLAGTALAATLGYAALPENAAAAGFVGTPAVVLGSATIMPDNSDITVALLLVLGARRLATRSPFRTAISLTRVAPKPVPGCGAASPGNPDILDGGSPGTGEARRGRG